MTTPLCIQCKKVQVQPATGSMPRRGWRVVDGRRWNWFCGRRCAGVECQKHITHEQRSKGYIAYSKKRAKARLDALIETLKAHTDSEGRVLAADLGKFILDRERAGYRRGYGVAVQRYKRERAA